MNADLIVVSLGLPALAWWVALSVYREWRKWSADRDRIAELTDQRDQLVGACEALTKELREADQLAIRQARKSLEQQGRIATVEGRELPVLAEIRAQRTTFYSIDGGMA